MKADFSFGIVVPDHFAFKPLFAFGFKRKFLELSNETIVQSLTNSFCELLEQFWGQGGRGEVESKVLIR